MEVNDEAKLSLERRKNSKETFQSKTHVNKQKRGLASSTEKVNI